MSCYYAISVTTVFTSTVYNLACLCSYDPENVGQSYVDVDLKRPSDRYRGVFVFALQVKQVHVWNCGKKAKLVKFFTFIYIQTGRL